MEEKNKELAYMVITPYTIAKSRMGGVLARLLSRVHVELVGAQMFAPTPEFAEKYAQIVYETTINRNEHAAELLSAYIRNAFSPSGGRAHRALLLLFQGVGARKQLAEVAGSMTLSRQDDDEWVGESIRDTYGDYVVDPDNPERVLYFEPAVLTSKHDDTHSRALELFHDFLKTSPNLVENITYPENSGVERTLVIIKPDNWRFASSRPGTIIDMFSRTGLRIIATKIQRMSLAAGMEFYGPVEGALQNKLGPMFAKKVSAIIESKFNVEAEELEELVKPIGSLLARDQFHQIVEFMTGHRPGSLELDQHFLPGTQKSMVLIYEGHDAVRKIREVLGPTDPSAAPAGTVRREFGTDVMVNTAHASDSPENALREMGIVKIDENPCYQILDVYLRS